MKKFVYIAVGIIVVAGVYYASAMTKYGPAKEVGSADYKSVAVTIDKEKVVLGEGGTKYFGNEAKKDLDGDGDEDVAFLFTRNTGGSGTFYYFAGALNTDAGYVGTDAVFLGDRVAPQTTESGPGRSVTVNFADRKAGEPMTVRPSEGKSKRFVLDAKTFSWGEVMINFEGEADPSKMTLGMKEWVWVSAVYNDGKKLAPKVPGKFVLTLRDGQFSAKTDCNSMFGSYKAEQYSIVFGAIGMTKMFCEGSQESDFAKLLSEASTYHFTSKGELVFGLKMDSGSAVFR